MQDSEGYVEWKYPHGALVPDALLASVDRILAKNRAYYNRYGKIVYLLSGILKTKDGTLFRGMGGNSKHGRYRYYESRRHNIRIRKDQLENVITRQIKAYLTDNLTVQRLIQTALKNSSTGLPIINEQIGACTAKVRACENTIQKFSIALREAAIDPTRNLTEVCKALLDERQKAEHELDDANRSLAELNLKRREIEELVAGAKLEEFLKKTRNYFDRMTDIEKND